MDGSYEPEVRRLFRIASVAGRCLFGVALLVALVAELVSRGMLHLAPLRLSAPVETLRHAYLGVSVCVLLLLKVMHRRAPVGGRPGKRVPQAPARDRVRRVVRRLYLTSLVSMALCLSICIYGFVLVLLARQASDLYLFLGLSVTGFVLFAPRYERWEREVERAEGPQAHAEG